MSLTRTDLNLFKVFEAVMAHRSAAGAARDLGVTPSAISHAIGRLRLVLNDEVFVFSDGQMTPTARALEIAPAVRAGLDLFADSILGRPFSPAESTRVFRVSATDYSASIIISRLVERLASLAPNVQLRVFPYNRPDVVRSLDEGYVDLVIGWFDDLPDRVRRTHILTERESLLVRKNHPLADGEALSSERILSFPFLVVELTGRGEPAADGFLDDRGVWRRVWIDRLLIEADDDHDSATAVAISMPYYSAVPAMLKSTDMVATVPERLARQFAGSGDHVLLDLPFPPAEVKIAAVWHERNQGDEALQWLLAQLADVGVKIDQD